MHHVTCRLTETDDILAYHVYLYQYMCTGSSIYVVCDDIFMWLQLSRIASKNNYLITGSHQLHLLNQIIWYKSFENKPPTYIADTNVCGIADAHLTVTCDSTISRRRSRIWCQRSSTHSRILCSHSHCGLRRSNKHSLILHSGSVALHAAYNHRDGSQEQQKHC